MLGRPRPVDRAVASPVLALVVALVTAVVAACLVTGVPSAGATTSAGRLPLVVRNSSGLPGATYVYVIARDQATGAQGWVDAAGTWHAFDLPAGVPAGTAPPLAPDVSIPGPTDGESLTVHLGPGLVGGRIYLALGAPLQLSLTPGGLVEPAAWLPGDPNHAVLYDWVEFARDGSRLFINTTMVDMFSVPLTVGVTDEDGATQIQGQPVDGGRAQVFADLAGDPRTAGLIQYGADGTTPLRAIAPVHGLHQGVVSDGYFTEQVAGAWAYYASTSLSVETALGVFTGRVTEGTFVFRDASGTTVASFEAPTTGDVFACQGALQPTGQPDQTAALAIGARLCAALNRGTLSTTTSPRSDHQPTADPASFYPDGVTSNSYSAAMHRSQVNGKAYGFAFDDVADLSPSIDSALPASARLTIGWVGADALVSDPAPTGPASPEPAEVPVAVEPAAPTEADPAPRTRRPAPEFLVTIRATCRDIALRAQRASAAA